MTMNQCPACGAAFETAEFCPWCGLAQAGPDANALRELLDRLAAVDRDLYARSRERDELVTQIDARRFAASRGAVAQPQPQPAVAPPPPVLPRPAPARPPGPPIEWNVERVRTILLWVGAALLAASALTFTAVAWSRLGDAGRAALLVGFTGIATIIAVAIRKRLPATSEAFTALTVALLLVDWLALRRAGIAGDMSVQAWWAIGSAVVGLLALALGEITTPRAGRRAAAILFPASSLLLISVTAGAPWSAALGLAMLAAAIALVYSRIHGDALFSVLLAIEGIAIWLAAALVAAGAAAVPATIGAAVVPAFVVLALGVAPLVIGRRELALAVVPGALVTLAGPVLEPQWLVAYAAVVGAISCASAPWVRARWRNASLVVGGAYALPGLASLASVVAVTTFGPLAWMQHAWTGDLDAVAKTVVNGPATGTWTLAGTSVLVVAAAAVFALLALSVPKRRLLQLEFGWLVAGAIAVGAACAAPVVAGASALVALSVAVTVAAALVVGASFLDRARPQVGVWLLPIALLALVPAAGWAAMTSNASVAALLVAMLASAAATDLAKSDIRAITGAFASGSAIALSGVWAVARDVVTVEAGFIVATIAGAVFVLGALVRRRTPEGPVLEFVGVAGMVVGASMAAPSHTWLAAALTVAVAAFVLGALRADRRIAYGPAAAATALGATGAWLAAAEMPVGPAGFILSAAASSVLVFAALGRRDAPEGPIIEAIGVVGMVIGASVAAQSLSWLAGSLTLAVPVFAVAALRPDRRVAYGAAAAASALGATWAWLAAAGVTVVEAYTLPAAAVALGAGLIAWHQRSPGRSWLTLGPAIVIGLAPTLNLAIQNNDPARTIATATVAAAIMAVGAYKRLQAPLVLGAGALLLLAIDTFGPAAARLPRWVPLAIAGILLMWLGARFERTREAAHRASRMFHGFG